MKNINNMKIRDLIITGGVILTGVLLILLHLWGRLPYIPPINTFVYYGCMFCNR